MYRRDLDVRMKSVLVEQYNTASMMGHEEMTRQELVLKELNSLLQCDDAPFPCDLLLDGSFAASGSQIPVVETEPLLFGRAIGQIGAKRCSGLVEACFLDFGQSDFGQTNFGQP